MNLSFKNEQQQSELFEFMLSRILIAEAKADYAFASLNILTELLLKESVEVEQIADVLKMLNDKQAKGVLEIAKKGVADLNAHFVENDLDLSNFVDGLLKDLQ